MGVRSLDQSQPRYKAGPGRRGGPGSPRARELDFRSQQSHAAERWRAAPQGARGVRIELRRPLLKEPPASASNFCNRGFPRIRGEGPRGPIPFRPPPEPRRGRPLLARGFAAPPAGSSLRMALVRGPADPHARPSAKKLGSQVQKTHGRGRGAAGRGKTQGCRPPRSRR